jgi:FxsC-like protein
MSDYCFFFSYASADRQVTDRNANDTSKADLVKVFFDNLQREIQGYYSDGGFFDKERLEAKWKPELARSLASSRILVPLYSRNYFRSVYCGKEWETFRLRFEENETHRFRDVQQSQVILPVLWKAPVTRPDEVSQFQMDFEHYPGDYEKEGLEYLLRFKRRNGAYQEFVYKFAQKLVKLADAQGDAKVRDVRDFDTLNAPFPGRNQPGLKNVRYVFVAGLKADMPAMRSEAYGNYEDRRDWHPFAMVPPTDPPIEPIATGPAKADNRTFELLPPKTNTIATLREARRLNNVILLAVDPWSVKLPELHQFLQAFDAEEFPNSAVLVNWNSNDAETVNRMPQLRTDVDSYFRGRVARKEFHKDPVSTPENFARAVVEAFTAVQARLTELGRIRPADGDAGAPPVIGN